jgi:hypothetical protein
MVVKNDAEAAVWQNIEKALRRKLNFKLHSGDMVRGPFSTSPLAPRGELYP